MSIQDKLARARHDDPESLEMLHKELSRHGYGPPSQRYLMIEMGSVVFWIAPKEDDILDHLVTFLEEAKNYPAHVVDITGLPSDDFFYHYWEHLNASWFVPERAFRRLRRDYAITDILTHPAWLNAPLELVEHLLPLWQKERYFPSTHADLILAAIAADPRRKK